MHLRYNFVLQATDEQGGYLGYCGKHRFAGPDLVAEKSQVLGRRNDGGNQFAHGQERVLKNETSDIASALVLGSELDADGATKTLSKNQILVVSSFCPLAEVIKTSLCVDVQAGFVGLARRCAIASVFKHKNITASCVYDHAGNG